MRRLRATRKSQVLADDFLGIEQIGLAPERDHDVLSDFFRNSRVRALFHQVALQPRGKVIKQFNKCALVAVSRDLDDQI